MPVNDRLEITWAPRVSLARVRSLYLKESQGICDDALVDEVGIGLFARCASILEYTQALAGTVRCKRCSRSGNLTLIERKTRKPSELLRCPVCSWQIHWKVYVAEAEKTGGNLGAGNAGAAFQKFVTIYPGCRDVKQKILAIDELIHQFHWNLVNERKGLVPHKPAGVNLLQGSTTQVIEMLDALAYGEAAQPELIANRDGWRSAKPIQKRFKDRPDLK